MFKKTPDEVHVYDTCFLFITNQCNLNRLENVTGNLVLNLNAYHVYKDV